MKHVLLLGMCAGVIGAGCAGLTSSSFGPYSTSLLGGLGLTSGVASFGLVQTIGEDEFVLSIANADATQSYDVEVSSLNGTTITDYNVASCEYELVVLSCDDTSVEVRLVGSDETLAITQGNTCNNKMVYIASDGTLSETVPEDTECTGYIFTPLDTDSTDSTDDTTDSTDDTSS